MIKKYVTLADKDLNAEIRWRAGEPAPTLNLVANCSMDLADWTEFYEGISTLYAEVEATGPEAP